MNKEFTLFFVAVIFIGHVEAQNLFQDPYGHDFDAAMNSYKHEGLRCLPNCEQDNLKKQFVVALLKTFDKKNELSVSYNCKLGVEELQDMSISEIYDATYELSKMYYHGICLPIDLNKSRELMSRAAEHDYLPAQKFLGKAYGNSFSYSDLYKKDYSKSFYWLLKSARGGDGESSAMVSAYYRKGLGVEKNKTQSFDWALKTVNSKYPLNNGGYYWRLAGYYETGYGTEIDLIKSYKYFDLSGTSGEKGKKRISKKMTDTEIQEAIQQSRAWQEEHRTFVPSYNGLEHQSDGSYH